VKPTQPIGEAAARPQRASTQKSPVNPKLAEVARKFEAILLQKLVSVMRTSVPGKGMTGQSASSHLYDHIIDSALASHMASGGGVGVSDALYRDWTGKHIPSNLVRAHVLAPNLHSDGSSSRSNSLLPSPSPRSPVAPAIDTPNLDTHTDDGVRPLREMVPPTGLEPLSHNENSNEQPATPPRMLSETTDQTKNFLLNPTSISHDDPSGRHLWHRGIANGFGLRPTNQYNGQTVDGRGHSTRNSPTSRQENVAAHYRDILGVGQSRYKPDPAVGRSEST
jgi:hypothetical protein